MTEMNHIGGNKAYWEALCKHWDTDPNKEITYTIVKTAHGFAGFDEKGSKLIKGAEVITEIKGIEKAQKFCTEYNLNTKR